MDKQLTAEQVVAQLESGMTIGVGGWGSRRKPMALIRAIARSELRDLTIVAFGGPDVGLLCAAGKVRKLVFGFVSLDSIPLEPHFRRARQAGAVEVMELDEGMLQWGLYAASIRLPFLPTRAGLGSDVMELNPSLTTVANPYDPQEVLVAMPALNLDAALVHVHAADAQGNLVIESPDPFFDDLFCGAAERAYASCEALVPTSALASRPATLRIPRMAVAGVIDAPHGAHPTECPPAYPRDEAAQKAYAATARTDDPWGALRRDHVADDEAHYRLGVAR